MTPPIFGLCVLLVCLLLGALMQLVTKRRERGE